MPTAVTVDLYKLHKAEYVTPRKPALVRIGKARYLTIAGKGEPGGELFQQQVGALYAAAWTVKMVKKQAGRDYKVMHLEGLWWPPTGKKTGEQSPVWNWKLLIRVPTFVAARDVAAATRALAEHEKARALPVARVKLEDITEGRSVQMLHVGPYETEPATIQAMHEFAVASKLRFGGKHHEIYLSDPRRAKPEKMRTILRYPAK